MVKHSTGRWKAKAVGKAGAAGGAMLGPGTAAAAAAGEVEPPFGAKASDPMALTLEEIAGDRDEITADLGGSAADRHEGARDLSPRSRSAASRTSTSEDMLRAFSDAQNEGCLRPTTTTTTTAAAAAAVATAAAAAGACPSPCPTIPEEEDRDTDQVIIPLPLSYPWS